MASTTDMAPTRSTTTSARRAANGPRRARSTRAKEEDLSAQVHQLQDDLKSIASSLAGMAGHKASDAQRFAKREAMHLADSGQHAFEGAQDEFGQLEKQIKDTIREKPLTAVAGAIALGFILAVVSR